LDLDVEGEDMKRKALYGVGALGLMAMGGFLGLLIFFTALGKQLKRR
jgi:hypothetical protein